ncbi:RidA family protein [Haliangium ochraceum]|uniref:Endoribonuclease L-PSP n=1 Tax=Haliangium ochraceum (strain DSM 14365 / JCM 11303 / SMP-2) TaxID=502025 RepID=D0LU09_HALO1|nr:RidA family protein [Haliangium ochraceum]ACY17373.1 Endoribonuclease L-PSP [Haliangium ochraceum DSM 14365]
MSDNESTPHRMLEPAGWPTPRGYANGVAARGTQVYVAGQVGWTSDGEFVGPGMLEQAEQAMRNILAVLEAAGARPEHLVRMTWYVIDMEVYRRSRRDLGAVYRRVLGRHFPAMALVEVSSLVEPDAVIEIEATAVIPDAEGA